MTRTKHFKRMISGLLVFAMAISLIIPASALEVTETWKFAKLIAAESQALISKSNYALRETELKRAVNPDLFGNQEMGMSMELSFSIQYNQPMRIEVYTMATGIEPEDVSLASGGADNLSTFDPRGDFVGYLYGSYEKETPRAFDGNMDTAQEFVGYDGDPPEGFLNLFSFGDDPDFDYNRVYWNGYIIQGDDPRDVVTGYSLGLDCIEKSDAIVEAEDASEESMFENDESELESIDEDVPTDDDVPANDQTEYEEPIGETAQDVSIPSSNDESDISFNITGLSAALDEYSDDGASNEILDDATDNNQKQDELGSAEDADTPEEGESAQEENTEDDAFAIAAMAYEADGTEILIGDDRDDQYYVIAIQPVNSKTAEYVSFIPIEIDRNLIPTDYTNDGGEYPYSFELFSKDPVNLVTGNLTWEYTDLSLYGAQELNFTRLYNSREQSVSALGKGWRHNYSYDLEEHDLYTVVIMPNGYSMTFLLNFNGSFTAPEGANYALVKTATGFTLHSFDKTEYLFDAGGNILSIVPSGGLETTFSYSSDKLASLTNQTGTLYFDYNGEKLVSLSDGLGRSVTYTYNGDYLISSLNPDGDSLEYTYNANGYLSSIVNFEGIVYLENVYDSNGCAIEQYLAGEGTSYFTYDFVNRRNTYTVPSGETYVVYYDKNNNITAVESSLGEKIWTFENGAVTSETDRLGNTTTYTYDAEGNRDSVTYPDGTTESYEYNSLRLVTKYINREGNAAYYEYDSRGNMTSYTDAKSNVSRYTFESNNNMLTSTDALGNTVSYSYDSVGNCLSVTDPMGNTTYYEYDEQGRLVLTTYADGSTVEYEYTTAGKLVKTIDADGNEYNYTVDGNGFDTGSTDPMGFTFTTVYNEQSKPIAVTDAEGNTTTYTYDELGSLATTTDALGNTTSYGYDASGRMTSMTDARGNTWYYSYDAEGRITGTTDPLNYGSYTSYDSMGRAVSSNNAHGAITGYSYDSMGRAVSITDALGNSTLNIYDVNGNLVEQFDKNGNKWEYSYDANNRLVEAKDPLGYVTAYTYDALGRSTKTVSALGSQTQYVYDSMGQLILSIDPEGNETSYEYDILGRLVKTTYADNTFTTSEYNANGWLVKATARDGGETAYTYNKNGQVLTITDAHGGVTSYIYDALGRTVSVTDALGGVTSYAYDQSSNLLSTTDANGNVTSYTYDALNRVVSVTDALGGVTLTEYDANGNVFKAVSADGGIITYEYDLLDRLVSYIDTEGYTFSYSYDANGNTISATDGNGNIDYTDFDALDRAVVSTDAAGYVSSVEYDADGRVTSVTDAEGAVTEYSYDLNGNIIAMTDAYGNATLFSYDSMNRVSTMIDAKGAVTAYTYTAIGSVETVTDALGGVCSYEYDLLGNLVKETNQLGKSTTYTYDALNRVVSTTNALDNSSYFTYNAIDQITAVTDAKGNVTSYVYDANGNVIETIDALGNSSYYEYDSMNRLVKVTLWRIDSQDKVNQQQITLYQYDKRGLVTKEINAAGNSTIYVYDGNGNLIQQTDADGYVTEYSYDPRNLIETINYSDSKSVSYAYNGNGELVEMVDWLGTTTYEIDLLNRIISVNDHNKQLTSYTYDAVGNQTAMTYPDNTIVRYEYDLLGRQTKVTDAENQITTYTCDAASRLIQKNSPNGWKEYYEYDDVGQLVKVMDINPRGWLTKSQKSTYTYDANGNLTKEYTRGTGTGQATEEWTYTYDALNRLTQTKGRYCGSTTKYTYDSLGNLTYEYVSSINYTDYKYNNLNQLTEKSEKTSLLNSATKTVYSYDKRGNLVKETEKVQYLLITKDKVVGAYIYDETNRMVLGANESGETSAYIYNGLGYRVGNISTTLKDCYGYYGFGTLSSSWWTPLFWWCKPTNANWPFSGITQPAASKTQTVENTYVIDYTSAYKDVIMQKENGGLTYRFTYGLDKISSVMSGPIYGTCSIFVKGAAKVYYHQDRLGSTNIITDNITGSIVSYISYNEWGEVTVKYKLTLGKRQVDLVAEYTGHPYDEVLELYFAEARMYDASDRRFVAMDVYPGGIHVSNTLNAYLYCLNNALKYVDVTGCFLSGTVFEVGAKGDDVYDFILALHQLYLDGKLTTWIHNAERDSYIIGEYTMKAVKEYINKGVAVVPAYSSSLLSMAIENDYSINSVVWKSLGLTVNATIAKEFWSGTKGNGVLSVTINGNTITINYSPKIYYDESQYWSRYFASPDCEGTYKYNLLYSDKDYSKITARIEAGFELWAGYYYVQGVGTQVIVDVDATVVTSISEADIQVTLGAASSTGGWVAGSFDWSTEKHAGMSIWLDKSAIDSTSYSLDKVSYLVAHEFGHTLGLMDAYGAWYQPQAPVDRATASKCIMWHQFSGDAKVSNTEIEMLLYAWNNNKMQGYSSGLLGEDSQAFYR